MSHVNCIVGVFEPVKYAFKLQMGLRQKVALPVREQAVRLRVELAGPLMQAAAIREDQGSGSPQVEDHPRERVGGQDGVIVERACQRCQEVLTVGTPAGVCAETTGTESSAATMRRQSTRATLM